MELTDKLTGNVTASMVFNSYKTTHNKNQSSTNQRITVALINLNDTQKDSFHPVISLAYSGYEGMKLAPWLTGIIFALVVFVILIPAFCSACYHYYRYGSIYYIN